MECTIGDDQSGGHKHNNTSWSNNNNDMNKKLKMGINSLEYPNESLYPWPPRNYKCSFCKREYKSAQALGGHMNIHRRERAKLRSDPPFPSWPNYITNYAISPPSNPNPNHSSSTLYNPENPNVLTLSSLLSPPDIYAHQYSPVSLSLSIHHSSASDDKKEEDGGVKLDLDLRLIRDTKEEDQDLDLELRLGTPAKSS